MALKKHHKRTTMNQMELLRAKFARLCWILQSSVVSRLKLDNQIIDIQSSVVSRLKLDNQIIDKTKKEVKIVDINIPGDVRVNKRKVRKVEKYKMLKGALPYLTFSYFFILL